MERLGRARTISRLALPLALGALLLAACAGVSGPATPGAATVPAETAAYPPSTYPAATSQAYPPPSSSQLPEEAMPTPADTLEAPAAVSDQFAITLKDNGRTFTYRVTTRFALFLDKDIYPESEQQCKPAGIASYVSNASGLYDEQLKLTSVGFEGVQPGTCVVEIRDFRVVIQIVDWRD
jgi:hypothetical protein